MLGVSRPEASAPTTENLEVGRMMLWVFTLLTVLLREFFFCNLKSFD